MYDKLLGKEIIQLLVVKKIKMLFFTDQKMDWVKFFT